MSSNREQLDKWVEATLIVAKAEGMDDATVIPTWSEDLVEVLPGLYPPLTVGAVRAIAQQSQTVDDSVKVPSAGKNFYGLDTGYFSKKLGLILHDMAEYTPTELARALARLAMTASSTTLREAEFNIGTNTPEHLADEPKYIDSSSYSTEAFYKVEKHGAGFAIYRGRDHMHHGENLGFLSECSPHLPQAVEGALNANFDSEKAHICVKTGRAGGES